ncbi:MAG: hypothetical protein AAB617_01035 [Patescibacteria group bacterium]
MRNRKTRDAQIRVAVHWVTRKKPFQSSKEVDAYIKALNSLRRAFRYLERSHKKKIPPFNLKTASK